MQMNALEVGDCMLMQRSYIVNSVANLRLKSRRMYLFVVLLRNVLQLDMPCLVLGEDLFLLSGLNMIEKCLAVLR